MTTKRTNAHNCLIISCLISVLLILLLAAALGYYATIYYMSNDEEVQLCESAGCIKAAEQLLESVDPTVDPCQDFYQFSCGKYINDTLTASGIASHFSVAENNFQMQVKGLLENTGSRVNDENFLKAQKYYNACMNTTLRENITAFTEDLEFLGGWPLLEKDWNSSDWMTIMMKMISFGYYEDIIIGFSIVQDVKNRSIVRIMISQPDLGLTNKENYINNSSVDILENYENFIVAMAKAVCTEQCQFNKSTVKSDVQEALDIEIQLAKMSESMSYFNDESNVYQPMTFGDLQTSAPQLDWRRFLQLYINESISDNETIIVPAIDDIINIVNYLSKMNSTLSGQRALANYMIYRMVLTSSKDLNLEMNHIYTDHVVAPLHLWQQCVTSTLSVFEISVIAAYQKLYYDETKRQEILDLVGQLKKQLAAILSTTSWLDEETKAAAIHKIYSIAVMVGYPNDFRNDTLVNDWFEEMTVGTNHFENTLEGNIFKQQKLLATFNKTANESSWIYLPDDIDETNAFYDPSQNQIFITIGISSDFYYSDSSPMYINYGRLGMIIGHELTHSIDQEGSRIDENGNERNWWQNNTLQQYENRSQCMIDLFSNYTDITTGLQINGNQSVKETTADSVGIREAYGAYLEYCENNEVLPLPALPYTTNQLFWISYATLWCEKNTYAGLENDILFDVHPPAQERVDGLVSNNDDFSKDFHCNLGTPMNRKDKCLIFGK